MGIEFTDRYGGCPPSGLRGCYECEAMGCYPDMPSGPIDLDQFDIDAVQFVRCEVCGGSGRCSWFQTTKRVPRWIVKSMRFTFVEAPKFDPRSPRRQTMLLGFKCSFLADLGLWRP